MRLLIPLLALFLVAQAQFEQEEPPPMPDQPGSPVDQGEQIPADIPADNQPEAQPAPVDVGIVGGNQPAPDPLVDPAPLPAPQPAGSIAEDVQDGSDPAPPSPDNPGPQASAPANGGEDSGFFFPASESAVSSGPMVALYCVLLVGLLTM